MTKTKILEKPAIFIKYGGVCYILKRHTPSKYSKIKPIDYRCLFSKDEYDKYLELKKSISELLDKNEAQEIILKQDVITMVNLQEENKRLEGQNDRFSKSIDKSIETIDEMRNEITAAGITIKNFAAEITKHKQHKLYLAISLLLISTALCACIIYIL